MHYISLFLIFFGVLLGQSDQIQPEMKWFWAWIPAEHKIVAYASDGAVNELLTADYGFNLKRIDDQTAVLVVQFGDEYSVYIVDSDTASFIAILYTQNDISPVHQDSPPFEANGYPAVDAVSVANNQVFIWNYELDVTFLFDRLTDHVTSLQFDQWREMRISADGQLLRYRVNHEDDNDLSVQWTLYEYDFINQTNRILFLRDETVTPSDVSVNDYCIPDQYGEHWYCSTGLGRYEGNLPVSTAQVISLNGRSRTVDTKLRPKQAPNGELYFLASEQYDMGCGAECVIQLFSIDGDLLNTFVIPDEQLPEGVIFNLYTSYVLDENRLILRVSRSDVLYMLSSAQLTYLGVIPCAPCTRASADGRWRILYDLRDEPKTVVWDLFKERIVVEQNGLYDVHNYVDGGITLGNNIHYSIVEDREYDAALPGYLIDILPGGVLIYSRIDGGIYRYTENQGYQPLVEGGETMNYFTIVV